MVSAQPGRRPVVLGRGDFCCLDTIDHQPENYRLAAAIHVDRESLLAGRTTRLAVRPASSDSRSAWIAAASR